MKNKQRQSSTYCVLNRDKTKQKKRKKKKKNEEVEEEARGMNKEAEGVSEGTRVLDEGGGGVYKERWGIMKK